MGEKKKVVQFFPSFPPSPEFYRVLFVFNCSKFDFWGNKTGQVHCDSYLGKIKHILSNGLMVTYHGTIRQKKSPSTHPRVWLDFQWSTHDRRYLTVSGMSRVPSKKFKGALECHLKPHEIRPCYKGLLTSVIPEWSPVTWGGTLRLLWIFWLN